MPTFRGKRVFMRDPYRSMNRSMKEQPGYFPPPEPKKLSQHDEDEMNRRRKPMSPNYNEDPSPREWQKMRKEMGGSSTSRKQDIDDWNEGVYY